MRSLAGRYRTFFRQPGVARLTLFGFLSRMPIGTVGIATLLHVRELTGSIAVAGATVGAQFVASAVAAPVQGRLIDTRGPRAVLAVTGVVAPLALLVILFAGDLGLTAPALMGAAVAVGAFATPTVVVMRTILRHRFDDEDARRLAYAIDGVVLEITYTVGPGLIAGLIAIASPQWALGVAWIFAASAVPLLMASGGLRIWKRQPAQARRLLGPLHEGRLVAIYVATFFISLAFGGLEVGYPGFAAAQGSTPWGPALIAINSIGSAVGGVVYGGLHLGLPPDRQLPRLLALFAVPVAAQFAVTSIAGMVPWAFLAGVLIAPSMTVVALLVSTEAPPKYATEAFTWSTTAIVTGIGAGMALSGWLSEHVGVSAPFALAGASIAIASALALRVARPPQSVA